MRTAVVEFLTSHGQFAEGMCDRAVLDEACGHIERLRDVFSLTLAPSDDEPSGMWRCPVDGVTTNGQHHFAALRPCGHVLRERVVLELAKGGSGASDGISTIESARYACPVCSAPVEVRVRLLSGADDTERMRETLRREREERKARKAEKKGKRKRAETTEGAGPSSSSGGV